MKKKAALRKLKTKKVVKKPLAKKSVPRKAVKKAVKRASKKPVKRQLVKKPVAVKRGETIIGEITHYFPHVRAAVVKLKTPLEAGATIRIKGHTTDFTQKITSIQIDRVPVMKAAKGQEVGVQVNSRVRRKDTVFKA